MKQTFKLIKMAIIIYFHWDFTKLKNNKMHILKKTSYKKQWMLIDYNLFKWNLFQK